MSDVLQTLNECMTDLKTELPEFAIEILNRLVQISYTGNAGWDYRVAIHEIKESYENIDASPAFADIVIIGTTLEGISHLIPKGQEEHLSRLALDAVKNYINDNNGKDLQEPNANQFERLRLY